MTDKPAILDGVTRKYKVCSVCKKGVPMEGLGICEECANRFCAYCAGECTHKWRYKGIEQQCILCGEWRGDVELTDYIHDSNAMLDRVIPAARKRLGEKNLLWWKLDGLGEGDYLEFKLDFSHGVDEFNLSIIRWALRTPLWDEFVKEVK